MTLFRFAAHLAPLLAGFGAAAALAFTEGRPPRRRLAVLGAVLGGVLLLVAATGLFDTPRAVVPAAALTASLGLLVATAYLVQRAARLPSGPAQVVASLVPVALYALVFVCVPVSEAGVDETELGRRITRVLTLSPIAVTTVSVLGDDFYHRPTFYRLDYAAYKHAPPTWTGAVAMYLGAAAALGALAAGLFAGLRKKAA